MCVCACVRSEVHNNKYTNPEYTTLGCTSSVNGHVVGVVF